MECFEAWEQGVKGLNTNQALVSLYAIKDSCQQSDEVIDRSADKLDHLHKRHGIEGRVNAVARPAKTLRGTVPRGALNSPSRRAGMTKVKLTFPLAGTTITGRSAAFTEVPPVVMRVKTPAGKSNRDVVARSPTAVCYTCSAISLLNLH